jgi:hypothetical protein
VPEGPRAGTTLPGGTSNPGRWCPRWNRGGIDWRDFYGGGQVNAAHYLAGGQQFGPFTSANITPDANGHPAGLTLAQFKNVIRTGHDPDPAEGGRLLQVMPWPTYQNMTDNDLRAIYEYLRSIPHAEPGP